MIHDDSHPATRLVVGASRGLGRAIASALAEADPAALTVAVARSEAALAELSLAAGAGNLRGEVAEAEPPFRARR